jgi:metal-responsive CopG/Arc/MetJ family transcriptional regulator
VQTIQVVLDEQLLKAADRAAARAKQNRSALLREALRAHLKRLETKRLEDVDRAGYLRQPADMDEILSWETVAAWPAD